MLYFPTLFSLPLQTWQEDHQRFNILYTFCEHEYFGRLFVAGVTQMNGSHTDQALFFVVYIATDSTDEELLAQAHEYLAPASLAPATEKSDIALLQNPIIHGGMLNAMLIMKQKLALPVATAALRIPFGTTLSYKELAEQLRIPYGAQAVGTALGNNQLTYIIPCHRIIRSDGTYGEYRWGAEKKKRLIEWERQVVAQREEREQEYRAQQAPQKSNVAQG